MLCARRGTGARHCPGEVLLPKKSNAADRVVRATASLLASKGYFGTALGDIIARSETPKGSLYHYFPDGKPEIVGAAIDFVSTEVRAHLEQAANRAPHARNALLGFTATLRGWLEASDYAESCPIFATTLSIDDELDGVHRRCGAALGGWHGVFEQALLADGLAAAVAERRAWLLIAALEGALGVARVQRSLRPLALIEAELLPLLP